MPVFINGRARSYPDINSCLDENPLGDPVKSLSPSRRSRIEDYVSYMRGELLLDGRLSIKGACFIRCGEGHIWCPNPSNLLRVRNKSWCAHKICSTKKILSQRDGIRDIDAVVREEIDSLNFDWKSGDYVNSRKESLVCACRECGDLKKYSLEKLRRFNRHCQLCADRVYLYNVLAELDKRKIEMILPVKSLQQRGEYTFRCLASGCNHVWTTYLYSVAPPAHGGEVSKRLGTGCARCNGTNPNISDKEFELKIEELLKKWEGSLQGMKWRERKDGSRFRVATVQCGEKGHQPFNRTINQLENGLWCRECQSSGQNESYARCIFEQLTGYAFPKQRPKWLVFNSKKVLELDGYCLELGIAFEHQGLQHYQYVPFFHRGPKSLERQKLYDQFKVGKCREQGITLVITDDRWSLTELESQIRAALSAQRPEIPIKTQRINFDGVEIGRSRERKRYLENARRVAREKHGKCLSTIYYRSDESLRFKCHVLEHNHWSSSYSSVVAQETWCPDCMNLAMGAKNRLPDEEIEVRCNAMGANFEGVLEFHERRDTPHVYKIRYSKCGHRDEVSAQQLRDQRKCKFCPNPDRGGAQRLDISDAIKLARSRGGVCLSECYINSSTKLLWKCKQGHLWPASYNSVRGGKSKKGSWCPVCSGRSEQRVDVTTFLKDEKDAYVAFFSSTNLT